MAWETYNSHSSAERAGAPQSAYHRVLSCLRSGLALSRRPTSMIRSRYRYAMFPTASRSLLDFIFAPVRLLDSSSLMEGAGNGRGANTAFLTFVLIAYVFLEIRHVDDFTFVEFPGRRRHR